jgi:hypothetical protein
MPFDASMDIQELKPKTAYHALKRRGLRRAKALKVKRVRLARLIRVI